MTGPNSSGKDLDQQCNSFTIRCVSSWCANNYLMSPSAQALPSSQLPTADYQSPNCRQLDRPTKCAVASRKGKLMKDIAPQSRSYLVTFNRCKTEQTLSSCDFPYRREQAERKKVWQDRKVKRIARSHIAAGDIEVPFQGLTSSSLIAPGKSDSVGVLQANVSASRPHSSLT
jgi:hypothetical protein